MQDEMKIEPTAEPGQPAADSPAGAAASVSSSRRRIVGSAVVAPVVLALSGRSALATGTTYGGDTGGCKSQPKGLSPLAWQSYNPKGGGTVCVSHTVGGRPLGCKPDGYKPKCGYGYTTFSTRCWPNGTKPFDSCKQVDYWGKCSTSTSWSPSSWSTYKDLAHKDESGNDAGWGTGTKCSWLDSRSLSQILLEESPTSGGWLKYYICGAYLNALNDSNYALTPTDCQRLYTTGQLTPDGPVLTSSECKAFLEQTWA